MLRATEWIISEAAIIGNRHVNLHRPIWMLMCFTFTLSSFAHPIAEVKKALRDEFAARREGKPFGTPTEPKLSGLLVTATLRVDAAEEYRFTVAAGTMIYLTDKKTGEKFGIVLTPILANPTPGFEPFLPANYEKGDDLIVHSFKFDGLAAYENKHESVSTENAETFIDDQGGSLTEIVKIEIFDSAKSDKPVIIDSLCCVSCGSYDVCGGSVSSSCGSCGGDNQGLIPLRD